MSTDPIERMTTLIVWNAGKVPHDSRRDFIAAAFRDLEEGGFDAQTRQQIERRVLDHLRVEPQPG